jgi:hypothetical protein
MQTASKLTLAIKRRDYDNIVAFHDQPSSTYQLHMITENIHHSRGRKCHTPENSPFVRLECLHERHFVLLCIRLCGIGDHVSIHLARNLGIIRNQDVRRRLMNAVLLRHVGRLVDSGSKERSRVSVPWGSREVLIVPARQ